VRFPVPALRVVSSPQPASLDNDRYLSAARLQELSDEGGAIPRAAEELSAISGQFHEDKIRAMLENLATEYLKMAEQMDGLSEIEQRLGARRRQS
jgi:hypothetical protein